jgi:hypothetical protein
LKKISMYSKTSVRSSALVGQVRPWMSSFLRVEEALGDGVIEAVAAGPHRLGDPGGAGLLTEGQRDELLGLKESSQHLVFLSANGNGWLRLRNCRVAVVAEARPEGGPERR